MHPIGGKITALFTARSPINRNPADNGVADWSLSSADVSKRLVIRNRIIDRSSILPATDPRILAPPDPTRVSIPAIFRTPRRGEWKKGETKARIVFYIWPGSKSDLHPFEQPPASLFEKLASKLVQRYVRERDMHLRASLTREKQSPFHYLNRRCFIIFNSRFPDPQFEIWRQWPLHLRSSSKPLFSIIFKENNRKNQDPRPSLPESSWNKMEYRSHRVQIRISRNSGSLEYKRRCTIKILNNSI